MSKKLIGAYDTESEVIKTVNRLKHDGYSTDEILLVANEKKKTSIIETQTSMKVEKHYEQEEEESNFWHKIKAKFKKESQPQHTDEFTARFIKLGIPEAEAKEHSEKVHQDKILVFAAEKSFHIDNPEGETDTKTPTPN